MAGSATIPVITLMALLLLASVSSTLWYAGRLRKLSLQKIPTGKKALDTASAGTDISAFDTAELLTNLAQNSQDFIWVTSPEGQFLFVSEGFEAIWGEPVTALYDDPNIWRRRVHPEDIEIVSSGSLARRQGPYEVEYRVINKQGDEKWVHARTNPIVNEMGLQRIVGTVRDVTESKRIELALMENTHLMQTAQKIAGFGTWVSEVYPSGKLTWSAETCRIFGVPEDEFDHSLDTFRSIVHPEDLPSISEIAARAIQHETAYEVEHRILRPDGEQRWVREYAEAEKDPRTGHVRLVGVVHDITDYRKLEDQLTQSQKMEAIGTLAGGIAHDFNNILMALAGNLEMARVELPISNPATSYIDDAIKSSQRATDLVNQILTFSRQQPRLREPVDLAAVVKDAIALLRSTLPASVKIEMKICADLPAVMANETQIHQVVMNLVTNAWQAFPTGTGKISIDLSHMKIARPLQTRFVELPAGEYLHLSISDDGPGISYRQQQKVFEPFYSTKPIGRGTGLGLSVVHGIAEAHEGALELDSQDGHGATFHVYLPASHLAITREKSDAKQLTAGGSRRILFIDDEEELVALAKRMLKILDYEVTATTNPDEAVSLIAKKPDDFDALITDMNMPGMSGITLSKMVRDIKPQLPILVTTGNLNAELEAQIADNNLSYSLAKPYNMARLSSALDVLFNQD